MKLSISSIEKAITQASIKDQQQLLKDLPRLLRIPIAQMALLKTAEKSFKFWNNSEDSCYDSL